MKSQEWEYKGFEIRLALDENPLSGDKEYYYKILRIFDRMEITASYSGTANLHVAKSKSEYLVDQFLVNPEEFVD